MSRPFIPPEFKGILKALRQLPPGARELVVRSASREALREGVLVVLRQAVTAELKSLLRVPRDLTHDRADNWRDQVWATVGRPNASTLAEAWPEITAELRRNSRRAAAKLPQAVSAYASIKTSLDDLVHEHELHRTSVLDDVPALAARRTFLHRLRIAVWGLEVTSAMAAVAIGQGVLDYPALSLVPNSLWLTSAFYGLIIAATVFALAAAISTLLRRWRPSPAARRGALVAALVAAGALVAGLGLHRLVGLLPAEEVTESLKLAELFSVAVLAPSLSLVAAAIAAEVLGFTIGELHQRLTSASQPEIYFRSQQDKLREDLASAAATVRSLRIAANRSAYYSGVFSREVSRAADLHIEARTRIDHLASQACAIWEEVQALSPGSRRFFRSNWDELLLAVEPVLPLESTAQSPGSPPADEEDDLDLDLVDDGDEDARASEPGRTQRRG